MTIRKLLLLILGSIFFHPTIFGQKQKNIFESYKIQISDIINDSTFQKVILSNEKYGSLTGYFKNDSFHVIVESYKQSYGTSESIFLFDKDILVFVSKKEINTKLETKNGNWIDTSAYLKFEELYQFINNIIVNKKITGKQNEKVFDLGDPYPFTKDSAKYFIFLAKKNKMLLSRKKQQLTKVLTKAGLDESRVATFLLCSTSVPADGILVVGRDNNQH